MFLQKLGNKRIEMFANIGFGLGQLSPPPGGGTSLSDHTGMCASFGWFLARKFWEWDVLFKERFWDWGLILARNSGNAQVWVD